MPSSGRCRTCGQEISVGGVLAGQCPRCLLQLAATRPPAAGTEHEGGAARRFGEFLVLRRLGRGPLGVVHEVLEEASGRRFALKRWGAVAAAGDADASDRSAGERGELRDPGVVVVHAAGQRGETAWVAMELMVAGSLRQRLVAGAAPSRLSTEKVLRIASAVAATLARVHERGVVHGGIKPENLLFGDDGRSLRLSDFALANAAAIGSVVGAEAHETPCLAPEQAREPGSTDAASDVYSLTACVLEALRTEQRRHSSARLRELLRAGLHPEPLCRPTAAELARELARAAEAERADHGSRGLLRRVRRWLGGPGE